MTDDDLACWEVHALHEGDHVVALIAEVRRLRALVMGPPTTKYCPKCGVRNSAFMETAAP